MITREGVATHVELIVDQKLRLLTIPRFLISIRYDYIFVLFHWSRLLGSLYQLFNTTKRYHPGSAAEDLLYYGGLNPACIDLDKTGRLIKNAYARECVREIDYAIWAFYGLAWGLLLIGLLVGMFKAYLAYRVDKSGGFRVPMAELMYKYDGSCDMKKFYASELSLTEIFE